MRIPRASRPFESTMTLAVRNSRATVAPDASLVAAGADVAEADPPEAVAAYPSVIDAERHPTYRDGVEHATTLDGLSGGHKSCSTSSTPPAEPAACICSPSWVPNVLCAVHGRQSARDEHKRRGRLFRWQEQR